MRSTKFELQVRAALVAAAALDWDRLAGGEAAVPSPHYLAWEKRLLADPFGYAKRRARPLWQKILLTAACLLLAASISLVGLMAVSPTARAWVREIFTQWFDDHAQFTFPTGAGQETGPWRTEYLPEGFVLEEEIALSQMTIITYKNQDGVKIRFLL